MRSIFRYERLHYVLLGLAVLVGLFVLDDHGLAWDEEQQRIIGQTSYNYVFANDQALNTFHDRTYGVAFELPLIVVEKAFDLKDSRSVYLMRHFVTHLFFLFSAFVFYTLCLKLFKNNWMALAGMLLLLTFPRLYAHSFFNTKDIPFLSLFIISWYTLYQAISLKRSKVWLLHAIVTGLLLNVRLMGSVMVGLTICMLLVDLVSKGNWRIFLNRVFIYISISGLVLFATWPFLWSDPFLNLQEAFARMSSFEWRYTVRYLGQDISAMDLPWHYVPVWIGITVPLHVLILGSIGAVLLCIPVFGSVGRITKKERFLLANAFVIAGSILAVIILGSTLYDDWRQLYFIYPCMLLLVLYGLKTLMTIIPNKSMVVLLISSVSLYQIWTMIQMIKAHPNQQVVFNEIGPSNRNVHDQMFDLDHWGVSYRQALEHILQDHPQGPINVLVANTPGCLNKLILDNKDGERIICQEDLMENADYYITNYRWGTEGPEFGEIVWASTVQGDTICGIYTLE